MSFSIGEKAKLGECIELIIDHRGKTPKKMGGDWCTRGIRTISAKNIHRGELTNIEDIRFVSVDIYKKWMKEDIKNGDCLLVSEGATLGENMYWDSEEKVVLGQRLFCIRTKGSVLDAKYFSAYMNTRDYQKEIDGRATGTSVLGLRQTELLNTKVLLKSIEEQRYIGDIYYKVNKKIEVNNQINKTLEEMAQTIFKQWFVDFDFPYEDGKPYKSSGGEMIESEMGMIPKGWGVKILGDLVSISTKSIKPKYNKELLYEYYSIPALDENKYPKFELGGEIKSNKYKIFQESILISKLNPATKRIWRPLNITGEAICSTEFINYIPKSDDLEVYCYSIIDSTRFTKFLINHATGSTGSRQRVKPKETLNYKVIYPKDPMIIIKYSDILRGIYSHINNNILENQRLIELRNTLLPKLMSGEIRVPINEN